MNQQLKQIKAEAIVLSLLLHNDYKKQLKIINEILDEGIIIEILKNRKLKNKSYLKIDIFKQLNNENKKRVLKDDEFLNIHDGTSLSLYLDNMDINNNIDIFSNQKMFSKLSESEVLSVLIDLSSSNAIKVFVENEYLVKYLSSKIISIFFINDNSIDYFFENTTIPFEKSLYIINELNIDKDNAIKKYYNKEGKFEDYFNEMRKQLVIDFSKIAWCDKFNYIQRDLVTESFLEENILEITKEIIHFSHCNEKIDMRFMQTYINVFINKIAKDNNISVNSSCEELENALFGYYLHQANKIAINKKLLTPKYINNLELFETIFHEIEHAIQYEKLEQNVIDFENLRMAKDFILKETNYSYINNGQRMFNYNRSSHEIDARCKSVLYTYQMLKEIDKNKAQEYLLTNIVEYKRECRLFYESKRKNTKNQMVLLEELFDKEVDKETIKLSMKSKPILAMEYDRNTGDKIDIVDIMSNYYEVTKKVKDNSANDIERKKYIFYLKYFKNKKRIFIKTCNAEIYKEYQQEFLKLTSSSLYKDDEIYHRIVDDYISIKNNLFDKNLFR